MSDLDIVSTPLSYKNNDPVKRIVADSGLKFARPSISAGGKTFTWPVGVEGFEITGQAFLGIHHYIGDNVAAVNVIHFDERRITLSGTLPGLKSTDGMVSLQDVVTSRSKKILKMPGILPREQYVVTDNYNFRHDEDDRTSSIVYSVVLIRVGAGDSAGSGKGSGAALAATASEAASGAPVTAQRASQTQSQRTFAVVDGVDTFRAISARVYGNVDQWPQLVTLNANTISINNPGLSVRPDQMAYYRWPVGTKIRY